MQTPNSLLLSAVELALAVNAGAQDVISMMAWYPAPAGVLLSGSTRGATKEAATRVATLSIPNMLAALAPRATQALLHFFLP